MAPSFKEYRTQLQTGDTGENIIAAGGKVQVCLAGSAKKATILDANGIALPNPFTPVRGFIYFLTPDTIPAVDLYVQDPFGNFVVAKGIVASGPNEIKPLSQDPHQVMVIPFHWADGAAAAERSTGFVIPANALISGQVNIQTTVADAGITLSAGLLSTDAGAAGGDATIFANAVSVAATGAQVGGPAASRVASARTISYSLSAGADTAEGFMFVPIRRV